MADIGILGGTFDPPHFGHLRLASLFKEALKLDRILIMPSCIPPHKSDKGTSSADRLEMCRLAAEEADFLEVCDIELRRGGKSYTVDTMRHLTYQHPKDNFFFLMGGDMFLCFDKWRCYEEIFNLCTICAISREAEHSAQELTAFAKKLFGEEYKKVKILKTEPMEVSSTEVRGALAHGDDISSLVPEKVRQYISERGLYR